MTSVVKRPMVGGQIGLLGANVAVISTQGQGQEALQDLALALNHHAAEASALETLQRLSNVMTNAVRGPMEAGVFGQVGANAAATLTLELEQRMPLEPAQALPPAAAGKTVLEKRKKQRNVTKNAAKRQTEAGLIGQLGAAAIVTDKVGPG